MILVGNKLDIAEDREVSTAEGQDFASRWVILSRGKKSYACLNRIL